MTETFYKSLGSDGIGFYSHVQWPLDGGWIEAVGDLNPCSNGIHVCKRTDLVRWLDARIFIVECDGDRVDNSDKTVFRRARVVSEYTTWNSCTQRLFAADCAEQVLHLFERQQPNDDRVRECIEVTRAFARGHVGKKELTAARTAARGATAATVAAAAVAWGATAATDATRTAAWTVIGAVAGAVAAAWTVATVAAADVARTAARDAAAAVVESTAKDAQTNLLFDYLEGRRT